MHPGESPEYKLLPPASEGWGKVIFSLCVSVHTSTGGGGIPQPGLDGGGGGVLRSGVHGVWVPQPGLDDLGGTLARSGWWGVGGGGVPHPRSEVGGGVPHSRSEVGEYPIPSLRWGVPHPRSGGYPARSGWWGVLGVPPGQVWMVGGVPETPPQPGLGGWGVPGVPPMPGLDVGGYPG